SWITVPPICGVLFGKVAGEGLFSFALASRAAAKADLLSSVEDDIDRLAAGALAQVEAGRLGWARHCSVILSMASGVVNSLPAIRHVSRRPARACDWSHLALTPPSGSAKAAAVANRMRVVGVISGRARAAAIRRPTS